MQIIPLVPEGAYKVSVDLGEGVGVFTFRTRWSPVAGMWFVDIYDANEAPLILGLAAVPDINIVEPYPEVAAALGDLRIADISGDGNATPETFGVSGIFVRVEEGDLPEVSSIPEPIIDLEDVLQ